MDLGRRMFVVKTYSLLATALAARYVYRLFATLHGAHERLVLTPCDGWIDEVTNQCREPRPRLFLFASRGGAIIALLVRMCRYWL